MNVLEHLLRASPPRATVPSLGAWLDRLTKCPFEEPIDRALWSGFEADRLGYAFVGGYQAALGQLLIGEPSRHARLSLAATEAGGAHPRAIQTVLAEEGGKLLIRGEKTFATLASVADELLVIASRGLEVDGRNRLVLVRVRKDVPGVSIEDRPPTPFAPEISHSRVRLINVGVTSDDVLPGDGYTAYLKPFRTIEDTYVVAATLAYMVGIARTHGFAPSVAETALGAIVALQTIAARPPSDPVSHIVLSGLFDATLRLISSSASDWAKVPSAMRERWERDQPLLVVASQARQQRTAAAWQRLASEPAHRIP